MADTDIHVVVKQFLLLNLDHLCLGLILIVRIISLDIHVGCVVNALHITIVHKLVLFHYVFGRGIINAQHGCSFFDGDSLGLHDVDQMFSFVVFYLNVVSLSSK